MSYYPSVKTAWQVYIQILAVTGLLQSGDRVQLPLKCSVALRVGVGHVCCLLNLEFVVFVVCY